MSSRGIIDTPPKAMKILETPLTDPSARKSIRVPCATVEQGLEALEMQDIFQRLQELQAQHEDALHRQIHHMLIAPVEAFSAGYVLLNGTQLPKANFPRWQKLVDYQLATELEEHIQLLDLTKLYLRPALADVGSVQQESLPNIKGSFALIGVQNQGTSEAIYSENAGNSTWQGLNGSANQSYPRFRLDASRFSPTYGRREEVAPISLLTYVYAYVGKYHGELPPMTTYHLIDDEEHTIQLLGEIGYNPLYMIPTTELDSGELSPEMQ